MIKKIEISENEIFKIYRVEENTMKKIWTILALLLLSLALVAGCGNDSGADSAKKDADDPLADGVLTVAVDDTYLPMEFRNDKNELVGFDIDLIEALGKELGVKTEIQTVAWDGIFTGLNANQYDAIISSTSITPERQKAYAQSNPYIANGIVIATNKDNATPAKDFKGLEGKTVGVQLETSADIAAQKLMEETGTNITLKQYDGMLDAFSALEGKQIDYVMTDTGVAQYYVAQKPETFVVTTDVPLTNEPIGVTMRKDSEETVKKINDALDKLRENGTLKQISEKWFGKDMTSDIDTTLNVIE